MFELHSLLFSYLKSEVAFRNMANNISFFMYSLMTIFLWEVFFFSFRNWFALLLPGASGGWGGGWGEFQVRLLPLYLSPGNGAMILFPH